MTFNLPAYHPPLFDQPPLADAPLAVFEPAPRDKVAPAGYHATSMFPEYLHLKPGGWRLLSQSRMDCVVVKGPDGGLRVTEFRHLKAGDLVAMGRGENGEQGIYVHDAAFSHSEVSQDKFAFRGRVTRETSFSVDYDQLYQLLRYEREHGYIIWVAGPAVAFDADARNAMASLVESGYVQALLAGNALATHDLEAALMGTALGQEIYSKRHAPLGHYNHLDTINRMNQLGGLRQAVDQGLIKDGIVKAALLKGIPLVLAGSIRDDGPLPGIISDACQAQDAMRSQLVKATTVITMASQLHSIATGNMLPNYHVLPDGKVRPVFFYMVDLSEFAADKLANRGSLAAQAIITNVQDFVVNVARGLSDSC